MVPSWWIKPNELTFSCFIPHSEIKSMSLIWTPAETWTCGTLRQSCIQTSSRFSILLTGCWYAVFSTAAGLHSFWHQRVCISFLSDVPLLDHIYDQTLLLFNSEKPPGVFHLVFPSDVISCAVFQLQEFYSLWGPGCFLGGAQYDPALCFYCCIIGF